jgi:hypothetical protein
VASTVVGAGGATAPARPAEAPPGGYSPGGPGAPPRRPRVRRVLPRPAALTGPGRPFVVLISLFPVWWLLGLSEILVFVVAGLMAVQLIGRRTILAPRGFGWWMIFLGFVLIGLPLLFVDAPGAVPGGGMGRVPVFGYRLAWYLSVTVVLLWIGNLDEKDLPTRRVVRLIGWMFVVTTAGGLLGILAPHFELTSLIERVLPRGLSSEPFVQAIAHPKAADFQDVLGPEEARPTAPFAYANSWGSNFAITLPFFLVGWLGRDAGWRRRVGPFILVIAAVPAIYSLNRGLWGCLVLGALFLAVRLALSGKIAALISLVVALALAVALLFASSLGTLLTERLDNAHSNGRRAQLLVETVRSTADGSPVAGFGSTRRVQGSFESIAGGSTPDCQACGVPPLGTQGAIWLVIFSQGFGGLLAFLMFFGSQLVRYMRSRTTLQAIGTAVLLFFLVQLFIYDTLGWPLYTVMIAIALMWRERWRATAGQETTA